MGRDLGPRYAVAAGPESLVSYRGAEPGSLVTSRWRGRDGGRFPQARRWRGEPPVHPARSLERGAPQRRAPSPVPLHRRHTRLCARASTRADRSSAAGPALPSHAGGRLSRLYAAPLSAPRVAGNGSAVVTRVCHTDKKHLTERPADEVAEPTCPHAHRCALQPTSLVLSAAPGGSTCARRLRTVGDTVVRDAPPHASPLDARVGRQQATPGVCSVYRTGRWLVVNLQSVTGTPLSLPSPHAQPRHLQFKLQSPDLSTDQRDCGFGVTRTSPGI